MFIFNLSIINFLTQPLPERENPNKDKLRIDKIKDNKLKEILQMNFLEMFYEFYREIKFDKKIVKEEWKKIIEYKKEMKENEEYDYKKYGIYAYIKEKKGRKAQYEYNILNKKTKRDSNSNIKSDNQFNDQKKTNQNVNSNSSLNNNENIPSSNNIHKDGTFNNNSNIVQTNQNVNYNLSLNNNEKIPASNNIHKDGTLNNDSNIVQTNQNVNSNSSLNNNENNSNVNNNLNNENNYLNPIVSVDTSFNNSKNDYEYYLFLDILFSSLELEKINCIISNSDLDLENNFLDDC
jgi:hypothetical protein